MFCFDVEGQEFAMKPMNCPGHCLMFAQRYAPPNLLNRAAWPLEYFTQCGI